MTKFQNINDQNKKYTHEAYLSVNLEVTGFGHLGIGIWNLFVICYLLFGI